MKLFKVAFLLLAGAGAGVVAVPELRGLRTDGSKKMMMSRKNNPMMSSKSKKSSKSKGMTSSSSSEQDCTLADGSSETPYGNRMMLASHDDEMVIQGFGATVKSVECNVIRHAVGDGVTYGGLLHCFPGQTRVGGEQAVFIKFRTGWIETTCVAEWFMNGLTQDNVFNTAGDLSNSVPRVPQKMFFAAVIDIVITLENGDVFHYDDLRVGETVYYTLSWSVPYIRYWWIGNPSCRLSGNTFLCPDKNGTSVIFFRRSNKIYNAVYLTNGDV